MPLQEATFRQFFRVVTSNVSLWYKDHSTANPLGVEPDPEITKVVVGDKFSEDGVEVVEDSGAWERRRLELDRIKAEVDQRCDWHKYYAGVCNCKNKKDQQDDEENEDEEEEEEEEKEEMEGKAEAKIIQVENQQEVKDPGVGSGTGDTGNEERDSNSKVCTML